MDLQETLARQMYSKNVHSPQWEAESDSLHSRYRSEARGVVEAMDEAGYEIVSADDDRVKYIDAKKVIEDLAKGLVPQVYGRWPELNKEERGLYRGQAAAIVALINEASLAIIETKPESKKKKGKAVEVDVELEKELEDDVDSDD